MLLELNWNTPDSGLISLENDSEYIISISPASRPVVNKHKTQFHFHLKTSQPKRWTRLMLMTEEKFNDDGENKRFSVKKLKSLIQL